MIVDKKSYAKVNIGLHVLNKREDNYHNLSTYFHKIDLFDDIQIEILESNELSVNIDGNSSYLTSGLDLMEKAAIVYSHNANVKFKLNIAITKRIPHEAGLAGGSSNAATILQTLNEYYKYFTKEELIELSLKVGSDLAFFLFDSSAAYALSRGEVLTSVKACSYPIIIAKKGRVSTKAAFSQLVPERIELSSWTTELSEWKDKYTNDFDIIQEMRKEEIFIKATKDYYNTTSGSGASQLIVFENEEQRERFIAKNEAFMTSYEVYLTKLI